MAELERTYNVPLRQKFMRAPKYKRSRKAVVALREFIAKHMKSEDVKIGKHLNDLIWENGIRNPPHHVKVVIRKGDDGVARAELYGHKFEEPTKEEMEKARANSKPKSDKKLDEKIKPEEELTDKALKNQKGMKEEAKLEKLSENLEKEELDTHGTLEEEKISETIAEIKAPAKKTPKKE